MAERADVSDIDAIEDFRARLVRYRESAQAAIASADAEVARTLTWLESEQIPYWDKAVRDARDAVTAAKHKWREKALFKDATGARSSAIDEKKALDRATRWEEDATERAKAARRHLIKLRKDESVYKGSVGRLSQFVDGRLSDASLELRQIVEQLERYERASTPPPLVRVCAPERAPSGKNTSVDMRSVDPEADVIADAETVEVARKRTPPQNIRKSASLRAAPPTLPEISALAREILSSNARLAVRVGRYDLVTTSLPDGSDEAAIYLERREPVGPGDTGWHLGPLPADAPQGPCHVFAVAALARTSPVWADLLSLPVGTLLAADAGGLFLAVDALGRTLWKREGGA